MCCGPWGCLGRGRAGGRGASEVEDRRCRSEDEEEPLAEPSTIHPTARSNVQKSSPLGSMAHAPPGPPTLLDVLKRVNRMSGDLRKSDLPVARIRRQTP